MDSRRVRALRAAYDSQLREGPGLVPVAGAMARPGYIRKTPNLVSGIGA